MIPCNVKSSAQHKVADWFAFKNVTRIFIPINQCKKSLQGKNNYMEALSLLNLI